MNLKNVEKKESNTVELTIEVTAGEFEEAIVKAYKQNAKKISLPGFRKGKAPRKMIERMYGSNFFWEDAVNLAYPDAYNKAVEEAAIEPVDKADVEMIDIAEEGFSFKATVTVRPEAKVSDYKGIEAIRPEINVTEKDVDAELDRMLQRGARIVTAEREAKDGDTVVIDFEGFIGDEAFEGGKGENHNLKLGSDSFIPGFEAQLVGKKAGDACDVNVTFPEEYHAENLAGKEAVFKVKVHEVKESILPELDDEFAKDVSEFDTLAELREDLKGKLEHAKQHASDDAFENDLMAKLAEKVEADIPPVMIENELDSILDNFGYRLASQGLDLNTYMQMTGMDASAMREMYRPQAEMQVKLDLAFEVIAKAEGFEVSAEEISEEYKALAERYNMKEDRVKTILDEKAVTHDLLVRKANAAVKESAVSIAPPKDDEAKAPKKAAKKPAKKAAKKDDDSADAEAKPKRKPRAKKEEDSEK
ncbi:trigger factor [Oscillospiraceae bacterium OttesenSCG-928-F05]|nr:trigger factor [Oscillospiraceae bacterium OttesenSCG-928-F05]